MKNSFRGTVRGRLIELTDDTGLPDGQPVRVTVEAASPAAPASDAAAREALRRAAGSWCDDLEELERYLQWNREQRKGSRHEIDQ